MNANLHFRAKTVLREFRGNWARPALQDISQWVDRISEPDFASGRQAVYLGTNSTDTLGNGYVWLIFDVESPGKHHDIPANIEAGRTLLALLCDGGLVHSLVILLTGWGLRFVWPICLSASEIPAFLEFVSERNEIDGGIFGADKFVRVAGSRNHPKQCKENEPPIDRHVHRLENPSDLWLLSADEYQRLTAGPPSKPDFMSWLTDILPKNIDPKPWVNFLATYKEEIELKGTLFSGTLKNTYHQKRPITEILDENSVDYTTEQSGEIIYYRLKKDCPSCGKTEGRPWVTSGGYLRDWRTTCAAGTPMGLPLSVWLPGVVGFESSDAPISQAEPIGEVKEIAVIRTAIADGVQSGEDVACHITPGGGKSTTTLRALLQTGLTGRTVFAVPEKSLVHELLETAKTISPDTNIVLLEGRNIQNCRNYAKVERVASLGFSPSFLVCPRCKRQNNSCDYFENQAMAFADGDRLLITSHAGLITGVDWNKANFNKIVVDESPLSTFISTKSAPWGAVQRIAGMLDPKGRKVIDRINKTITKQLAILEKHKKNHFTISRLYGGAAPAASQWDGKKTIWERAGITDDRRTDLLVALSIFERLANDGAGKAETSAAWQRRLYKAKINMDALENLWALIGKAEHCYINFTQEKNQPVTLCRTTKTLPIFDGQMVHLDGTMDTEEASALLERDFQIVDGRCELPGLKTVWIRQGGGKRKLSKMSDDQIQRVLKAAAAHLPETASSVLIGTHLIAEPTIKGIAEKLFTGRTTDTVHYFSSRGRNVWQNYDAFVGAGTPTPPEAGNLDTGFMLFSGDTERQSNWRAGLGGRELVQMAHRIRPIYGNKTIVIVGRDWPADLGKPLITIDKRRGDKILNSAQKEAVDRLIPFVAEMGFLHKETMLMHGICLYGEESLCQIAMGFMKNIVPKYHLPSRQKVSHTYYNNIGMLRLKSACLGIDNETLGMLVFKNRESIIRILNSLQISTGLPDLTYSSKATNGQKTRGIGYLESARNFYEMFAVPFAAESWTGTKSKI